MCWVFDCLWAGGTEEPNPDEGLEFLVTLFGLSVLSYFIGGGGGLLITLFGWQLAFCMFEFRGWANDRTHITPIQVSRRLKGRKQR